MSYLTKNQLIDQCTLNLLEKDWSDYFLLAGVSDAWVPYMIIALLKKTENHDIQNKRKAVFDKLHGLDKNKPIGYNRLTPNDCDSSIWYARAINSFGLKPSKELLGYIRSHQAENGKYSTYITTDNIHSFIAYSEKEAEEWMQPHDCVSVNGESLLLEIGMTAIGADKIAERYKNFSPYWWADLRIPLLMCNDKILSPILEYLNLTAINELCSDLENSYPGYREFSRLVTYLLQIKTNPKTYFPDDLSQNLIADTKSIMQIPDPIIGYENHSDKWIYDGLVQGARVKDINSIVTSAIILSNI
tara:strand:- start:815 stop:1720 length:906 start_codon:yes stop_codon:yes gene_type:complete